MFRRFNIKTLFITFIALLIVVIILELSETKGGKSSFRRELFAADTAKVTSIVIQGANDQKDVVIMKDYEGWKIEKDGKFYNADAGKIKSMLTEVKRLRPERVVANNSEKWPDYQVGDSLGYYVRFKDGDQVLTELIIGKFDYQQATRKMTSFVRVGGEDFVYAVQGFLRMNFQRESKPYMNSYIVKSDDSEWTQLRFQYPGGESFSLAKQGENWMVGGLMADSTYVENYFNSLARITGAEFAEISKVEETPDNMYSLTIEGNNFIPIVVKAVHGTTEGEYIIYSTQNKGMYFKSQQSGVFSKIFTTKEKLQNGETPADSEAPENE